MATSILDFVKTARPRQWVKNLILFSALIFTGNAFSTTLFWQNFRIVTSAVLAFTVIAGSIYYLNDVIDVKADRAHPFKKNRPIAAGRIPRSVALTIFFLGSIVGLGWAWSLSFLFFLVAISYWALQILYSLWLKNQEVVDVFVIALGFFLRVFAGAIVINAHLSIWFLLCVISVSLFLAVGKRRAELAILTEQGAVTHRNVMGKYTTVILDSYLTMFATSSFLSWALFTFNFYEQFQTTVPTTLILLSKTLTINKWLMASIPVVIFGIMRYIRIVYDGARAETPEKVILSDLPLLISVATWGLIVIGVLYWSPLQ
ncbi:MAG: decaprenyl-phosphate phosphoribosyltransferase [bacterium]|nr:decaprenyl-phosphate phosphoribosyltransferase [bacterium]